MAKAGGGIKADPFVIHFMSDLGMGYDSNVFLENDDQSDTFYFLSAHADIDANLSRSSKLFTSYEGTFYRFSDFNSQDSDNHSISVGFDYEGNNFYAKIKELYLDTSNIDGTIFTNRIERTVSEPSILLGIDSNKLAVELKYAEHRRRYEQDLEVAEAGYIWELPYEYYDHDRKYLSAKVIYHAFTKTNISLKYRTADIEYKESIRDGEFDEYMLGIKGELTSKIDGTIRLGYQDREYTYSNQSYDNFVSETEIDFKFSENMNLELNYLLTANEAIIFEYNYYEIDRLKLDFNLKTLKDFYLTIGGFLETDDFPDLTSGSRKDDVFSVFLYVKWEIRNNMAIQLDLDYLERDSNLDEYDYEQKNVVLYFSYVL